ADVGGLDTEAGLLAQAERLMADARSADVFAHFGSQGGGLGALPGLEKDRSLFRMWTDDLPRGFPEGARRLLAGGWQGQGTSTVAALLTAPVTYVNARLATFYGLPAPPAGAAGFARVDADPARFAGLLTQGAFLATHANADQTSPVKRG